VRKPDPTLSDVAEAAGVSVGAASGALDSRTRIRVSEVTRIRVREIARGMGYRRNLRALALAKGEDAVKNEAVARAIELDHRPLALPWGGIVDTTGLSIEHIATLLLGGAREP
jgi:DNA-binding LacI/PurR family transcriptional regulator